ncbi:MAG: hypothetical protein FK733_13865 [Asgard group archaeon]|nr:hypothetical protein [Asgard group archaeon]
MSKQYEKITKVVLELTTCKKFRASTDDAIEIYIGEHEWDLDVPFYDDFEKGKTDTYDLEVPDGMDSSWFHYFCLRKKAPALKEDDWCLEKIKLTINDKVVYEFGPAEIWLKQVAQSWCAPGFTYGKAGE